MFCSQCGSQNEEGAAFCGKCGAPLAATSSVPQYTAVPPQGYGLPQGYGRPQSKGQGKKKTGLIIGLVIGLIVLLGATAFYFLVLSGQNVKGTWQCQERGWVLQIDDKTLHSYGLGGTESVSYQFDKKNGNGSAGLKSGAVNFVVGKDQLSLTVKDKEGTYVFTRTSKNLDIDETVLKGLEGLWSSEERAEVIELKEDGAITVHSVSGDEDYTYTYDMSKGSGTITSDGDKLGFSADWDAIEVEDIGSFKRADKSLDITAFIKEYGNPLIGTWYDTEAVHGDITFNEDYTFELATYGQKYTGTYTFDPLSDSGSVTLDASGVTGEFSLSGDTLTLEGVTFTMDIVEQPGAGDDTYAIAGSWYETSGAGSATFNEDGSVEYVSYGEKVTGTYTYDPLDLSGTITLQYMGGTSKLDFQLGDDEKLDINGYMYTRDYVAPLQTLQGTWYDVAGQAGTIYFDAEGVLTMESGGQEIQGTYTFDAPTGKGTISLNGGTWDMTLLNGTLTIEDVQFTQNYVAQN